MGSSISRGRKFSPTKNVSDQNPTALIKHAKFSCGDPPDRNTEFVEEILCKESDIKENEMKVFDLGQDGGKVLLIKQKGKISALGTKCTHYGASLVNGYLGDGRLRCPWHGACFNISNGDIEDFPGLDSLPCYEVKTQNNKVSVRASRSLLKENKRLRSYADGVHGMDKRVFVVVGGGPAGATCVETLRQEGFSGRIVFCMRENSLPYDRVKLSKSLNVDVSNILLRSKEFYVDRMIECLLGTSVTMLNPNAKKIQLSNGSEINYDKIFLATGGTPNTLEVPGSNFKNIFTLRTYVDAEEINKSLSKSSRVVIVGTSFIGMETAAYCVDKVKSVIIVGRHEPFKSAFGTAIGNRIMKLFEEKHVQIKTKHNVKKFEGKGNKLTSVILQDNTELPADICLIGIGTTYNTAFLNDSGIRLEDNGSIDVNEFLETHTPDVYAGGDVVFAPVLGKKLNIGHWGSAQYHGHIAAFNMLGKKKPLKAVPFFWTMLFGKSIRYAGCATTYDDVVIDGSLEELTFIAFFCFKNVVLAVATINRDPLASKFAELLYRGEKLAKKEIFNWIG